MQTAQIATAEGTFTACFSERGLVQLRFPSQALPRCRGSVGLPEPRCWIRLTEAALHAALSGRTPKLLPPLDLSAGTAFQRRVWAVLRQIRSGQTRSYQDVAGVVGKPKAARAVGGACGANPIPILVPCHRVVASDGGLGGFSGGLNWKRRLLAIEGVCPDDAVR